MEEFREKIFGYLIEINDIVDKIDSEAKKGARYFLWDQAKNFVKIRILIVKIKELDRNLERFSPDDLIMRLLGTSIASQNELFQSYGEDNWYFKFKAAIKDFQDVIFDLYIYRFTYDTFSENSRDNDRKANILMSLVNTSSALLEIGPGTGPLFRRLIRRGYDVNAIEYDSRMIHELFSRCSEAQGRVINADFFEYNLGENIYDMIFIESGIFLFTLLNNKLFFELFPNLEFERVRIGFNKIFRALKRNGMFLIGIQGLMKKVDIGRGMTFEMKRTQLEDRAEREINWCFKKGYLSKKKILYKIRQSKPTIPFEKFLQFSFETGFRDIQIHDSYEWVILRKD
ncbi:methyltransferase domain-containing protein [Candidatus Woesearchaeota archaeon]|nr:methyltransferase domain-containing protein [Candidatus Woesearchaeota archaeon]